MNPSAQPAAERLLDQYPPISLDSLQATAALRTRMERKYLVDWATLKTVTPALAATHKALEIEGRRTFEYETVYFDTPQLGAYRAHLQGRRRRYKIRSRRYVDSRLHFFELKLKGPRGETIKHQLPYTEDAHGAVTPDALVFLADRLAEAYPNMAVPQLRPTLHTNYRRWTLVDGAERLTCDFDLTFSDGEVQVPGLNPEYVILETKSARAVSAADRELRRLGVHPLSCSKYCVGIGLTRDDVRINELRWLLGRYFHAAARPERAYARG